MTQPSHTGPVRADQRATQRVSEVGRQRVFFGSEPPTTRRIYVCGPMSGYPDLNHPAFHLAASRLRAQGYVVVSPAEHPIAQNPQTDWHEAVRGAIRGLLGCHGVATVTPSGLRRSKGAQLELRIAHDLEIPVLYWQAWIQAADAWTDPRSATA